MINRRVLILITIMPTLFSLSACSSLSHFLDSKASVNYSKNSTVKALEIPPDLSAPQFDTAFTLPAGTSVSEISQQSRASGALDTPYFDVAADSTSVTDTAYTEQPASSAVVAPVGSRTGALSSISTQAGSTVLLINDNYSRALVLTDIILERMGFSMINRNEQQGVYQVEYNGADVASNQKQNMVSRLFKRSNSSALAKGKTYQVHIKNSNGKATVQFKDANGKALKAQDQKTILTLMNKEFNR